MNRRDFIGTTLTGTIFAKTDFLFAKPATGLKISVFSKTLHWIEDYQTLTETVAEIGFDGIDLTVRPDGHVLPEKVEFDLPKVVQAAKKANIEIQMMTTSILQADALSERVLKTANAVGIGHYRMGWYHFDMQKDIMQQVDSFGQQMKGLDALNKKYKISGEYQNHGGQYLGAAVWDLQPIFKSINSPLTGCQYDVNHATAESGANWETGFRIIAPYIKSLAIKDFKWVLKNGKLIKEGCPLGEGVVDWKKYLQLVKQYNINVPITMHFEYDLGGAENGAKVIKIDKKEVISAMKKDLTLLKTWLKEAGL
ncbi:sugar phosphate isomerase/epimerase family protein [Emticicia sp.]|uniref:sugar phosphate isomerase/epimerase family protein n=1 Tax=Emticicia sp. TaxID=1930953 RepID=UPI0037508B53